VVIAIIGILAAIAIPRLGAFRGQADTAAEEANIRIMRAAAEMWIAENGIPATSQTDVDVSAYIQEVPENYTVDINDAGEITVNTPNTP